jgi:excisionase family DNA binding protein
MKLLTVDEVADILRVSRRTVYDLKRKIGYCRIGGAIRFREEDVEAFISESVCAVGDRKPRRVVSRHFS